MIVLFLNFWGIAILFSIAATPVYIPINSVWRYFFCIHSDTGHFLFFYNSHTNRCEMISYCVSHLYFLNNQWYWTSFHVLFGYLCPCGKKSIQIFCKFFKHFLLLSCMITLYILDIISYWICDFTNILSHVVGSVQFSHAVMFNSLQTHELKHARPPYPSPTSGVYSNPCPLSQWCHPTISSSVITFSSYPQSFPASGSYQISQLFASGGQSIGASVQHQSFQWTPRLISFRMDWLDLLADQGILKSLLQRHSSKASILRCSVFFIVHLSHPYMTTGKTIGLTRWTFFGKIMSLFFNKLSRLVITFLPRSKGLLISWL